MIAAGRAISYAWNEVYRPRPKTCIKNVRKSCIELDPTGSRLSTAGCSVLIIPTRPSAGPGHPQASRPWSDLGTCLSSRLEDLAESDSARTPPYLLRHPANSNTARVVPGCLGIADSARPRDLETCALIRVRPGDSKDTMLRLGDRQAYTYICDRSDD